MTQQWFLLLLVCYVAYTAKYLTYLLKSTEVVQIWEFDNLHMTQCAKIIIVGFMANVGNVFYPTFTNVFLNFIHVFYVFNVFLNFHLNVYYIYAWNSQGHQLVWWTMSLSCWIRLCSMAVSCPHWPSCRRHWRHQPGLPPEFDVVHVR